MRCPHTAVPTHAHSSRSSEAGSAASHAQGGGRQCSLAELLPARAHAPNNTPAEAALTPVSCSHMHAPISGRSQDPLEPEEPEIRAERWVWNESKSTASARAASVQTLALARAFCRRRSMPLLSHTASTHTALLAASRRDTSSAAEGTASSSLSNWRCSHQYIWLTHWGRGRKGGEGRSVFWVWGERGEETACTSRLAPYADMCAHCPSSPSADDGNRSCVYLQAVPPSQASADRLYWPYKWSTTMKCERRNSVCPSIQCSFLDHPLYFTPHVDPARPTPPSSVSRHASTRACVLQSTSSVRTSAGFHVMWHVCLAHPVCSCPSEDNCRP